MHLGRGKAQVLALKSSFWLLLGFLVSVVGLVVAIWVIWAELAVTGPGQRMLPGSSVLCTFH